MGILLGLANAHVLFDVRGYHPFTPVFDYAPVDGEPPHGCRLCRQAQTPESWQAEERLLLAEVVPDLQQVEYVHCQKGWYRVGRIQT